jgi:hypothetical protein
LRGGRESTDEELGRRRRDNAVSFSTRIEKRTEKDAHSALHQPPLVSRVLRHRLTRDDEVRCVNVVVKFADVAAAVRVELREEQERQ